MDADSRNSWLLVGVSSSVLHGHLAFFLFMKMDSRKKAIALIAAMYVLKSRRRRRRVWVHPILRRRKEHGEFHQLVQELRLNGVLFQQYFRLDVALFDELLSRVGPRIARMDTNYREAIGSTERLAICLRFLATGDSFKTIAFSYRVGMSTVGQIVPRVAEAIFECLLEEFMPPPTTEDWRTIAEGFQQRWNFPNCLGSIDGKHVVIQAPPNSGSWFYNYKGTFSIVLLALVDSEYLFRVVDVGGYGRNSDGGTLANSNFGRGLLDGTLDLPADSVIPGSEHRGSLPYVLVGDEAFPLRRCLMRPYPGSNIPREKRIFNYRLSRARLTVECGFGILASQWRMYHRVIHMAPEKVELCVKATCILHNFIRVTTIRGPRRESTSAPTPAAAAAALRPVGRMGSNNPPQEAIQVREAFCDYFNQEGAVAWQNHI